MGSPAAPTEAGRPGPSSGGAGRPQVCLGLSDQAGIIGCMGFDPQWAFRDCTWCGAAMVQMDVRSKLQATPAGRGLSRSFTVLSCPRCAGLTVVEHTADNKGHAVVSEMPRSEDVQHDVDFLPDDVGTYFGNARKALDVGLPDSAAVELRRTLEAATAAYGQTSGPLFKQVQKLIEDGHVTTVFEPALGYIRKIGNLGAHASDERLSEPEVRQAMTFTTLLLRNLFELPAQVKALEAESPPPPVEDEPS